MLTKKNSDRMKNLRKLSLFIWTLITYMSSISIASSRNGQRPIVASDEDDFKPDEHQPESSDKIMLILVAVFLGGPIVIALITCALAVCLCKLHENTDKVSGTPQASTQPPQRVALIPPKPITESPKAVQPGSVPEDEQSASQKPADNVPLNPVGFADNSQKFVKFSAEENASKSDS
ncbi:hypothetical protein BOX15_Mlig013579g1 [Macrostomum lignano]|uniref:Uncharacterized protein n=1 Tax=Macrostomum lignano TaxID=282301 RepID=A0A267FDH9_9PLAT|nr:hypothetical protein BOX15_Mlig013579g1 [Macrostomum lignano]